MPSRRTILLAGTGAVVAAAAGGAALVEENVLPGRSRMHAALGLDGPDGTIPPWPNGTKPGATVSGDFESTHRRATTGWTVAYPPGTSEGDRVPVLLALHGKSGDHRKAFADLGFDRFAAAAIADGAEPFAVASVDGGSSYWHRRKDGTDSGTMVTDEFVPMLAERGLDTSRLALIGWSMGGYGALWLAASGALQVRAVGTLSAALWTRAGDSAPGAFDNAEDFAAHDVFARRAALSSIPLRMDCGDDDPFRVANERFIASLEPKPEGGFEPGAHTDGYWRRMAPKQIAFVAKHLAE